MATHSMTVPSADAHGHTARVQVSGGQVGGWDVTATLDGRVVASRHCDDWHRAERARAALTTELLTLARRLVEAGALLVMLLGGPIAIAHAQDRPAAPAPVTGTGPTAIFAEPRAIARGFPAPKRSLVMALPRAITCCSVPASDRMGSLGTALDHWPRRG